MWTRKELKEKAKIAFKSNYWACFGVVLIAYAAGFIETIPLAVIIFLTNPIEVGKARFFVDSRTNKAPVSEILSSFNNKYLNTVLIMFLRDLFTALWSILLIIPGIVKSYEYLMIPYILADNPEMERKEVFALSKKNDDG